MLKIKTYRYWVTVGNGYTSLCVVNWCKSLFSSYVNLVTLSDGKSCPVVVKVDLPQCGHTAGRTHLDVVTPEVEIRRSFFTGSTWCEDGVVTVSLEVVLHIVECYVVRISPNLAVLRS